MPAIAHFLRRTVPDTVTCRGARTILVAAVAVGAVSAAISMFVAAIAAQVLFGDRYITAQSVLVVASAPVGAAIGGWWAQPRLDRLQSCAAHDATERRDGDQH